MNNNMTINSSIVFHNLYLLILLSVFVGAFSANVWAASPNTDDRVDIGQADRIKNEHSGQGNANRGTMDPTTSLRPKNPAENQHPPGTPVPNPNKPRPLDNSNSRPLPGGGNMNDAGQVPVHPVSPSGSNPGSAY